MHSPRRSPARCGPRGWRKSPARTASSRQPTSIGGCGSTVPGARPDHHQDAAMEPAPRRRGARRACSARRFARPRRSCRSRHDHRRGTRRGPSPAGAGSSRAPTPAPPPRAPWRLGREERRSPIRWPGRGSPGARRAGAPAACSTIAWAMRTLCCSPPESRPTRASAKESGTHRRRASPRPARAALSDEGEGRIVARPHRARPGLAPASGGRDRGPLSGAHSRSNASGRGVPCEPGPGSGAADRG